MLEKCLRAYTWASWSVAAFSRDSSFRPRSAPASRNTWVARAKFPRKSVERRWAGATEERIKKGPLVVRDREHPFAEDLITNGAGVVDMQSPVLTKIFCWVDAVRTGGSYELVAKLWAQFVLTAGQVNTEVAWTRDENMVGSVNFRSHFVPFQIYSVVLLLVNHPNQKATPNSVTRG